MSAAEHLDLPPMTLADHLAHEEATGVRHEIRDDKLVAMAGGTAEHNDVGGNLFAALHSAYADGNRCRPSGSDQMVHQPLGKKGVYPDVSAVCGEREFLESIQGGSRVVTNPTFVAEVLSSGTVAFDQGTKFERYLSIPSLREYVLIDPTTPWLRRFVRTNAGWLMTTETNLNASVAFESLGISVPMSRIYLGVPTGPRSTVRVPSEADDQSESLGASSDDIEH